MEEMIAKEAISFWGPFAMVVILLIAAIVILGRQYLARQKAYEERDDKRLSMYMQSTQEFTQTASDNNVILRELKDMVKEAHTMMVKLNERL